LTTNIDGRRFAIHTTGYDEVARHLSQKYLRPTSQHRLANLFTLYKLTCHRYYFLCKWQLIKGQEVIYPFPIKIEWNVKKFCSATNILFKILCTLPMTRFKADSLLQKKHKITATDYGVNCNLIHICLSPSKVTVSLTYFCYFVFINDVYEKFSRWFWREENICDIIFYLFVLDALTWHAPCKY
jgi:hypothetical protein